MFSLLFRKFNVSSEHDRWIPGPFSTIFMTDIGLYAVELETEKEKLIASFLSVSSTWVLQDEADSQFERFSSVSSSEIAGFQYWFAVPYSPQLRKDKPKEIKRRTVLVEEPNDPTAVIPDQRDG